MKIISNQFDVNTLVNEAFARDKHYGVRQEAHYVKSMNIVDFLNLSFENAVIFLIRHSSLKSDQGSWLCPSWDDNRIYLRSASGSNLVIIEDSEPESWGEILDDLGEEFEVRDYS